MMSFSGREATMTHHTHLNEYVGVDYVYIHESSLDSLNIKDAYLLPREIDDTVKWQSF